MLLRNDSLISSPRWMNPSKPAELQTSDESKIEGTSIPRKVLLGRSAVVGRKIPKPQQMTNESSKGRRTSMNDEFECSLKFRG